MEDLRDIERLCVGHGIRKAARRVTRRYDLALRGSGLTLGQFSTLAMIVGRGPIGLRDLAERLGMDRTTLTRDIKPLERRGLIVRAVDPEDGRARNLTVSTDGYQALQNAIPLWTKAQADSLTTGLDWAELQRHLNTL